MPTATLPTKEPIQAANASKPPRPMRRCAGWIKHLSSRSRYPGDWDPWLIWVARIGAFLVALAGYRTYFDRPDTEADIQREIDRLDAR